jgi:hypothetical protein
MTLAYLSGNRISGIASDTKPSNTATNSTFFETDTDKTFDWNGSAWVERLIPSSSIADGTIANIDINSSAGITVSKLEAGTKGDILASTGSNFTKTNIGSNDQVLTADSAQSTGLAWKSAGGGSEYDTLTNVDTFNPTTQTGNIIVTIDTTGGTAGNVGLFVDGSLVNNMLKNEQLTRIVTPSSSLSIKSLTSNVASVIASGSVTTTNVDSPTGVFFKPDGTKMYIVDPVPDDVTQFNLSTAWDVTTASYVSTHEAWNFISAPDGVVFSNDGTKYYFNAPNYHSTMEASMTTAWDITTASQTGWNASTKKQWGSPNRLQCFNTDGTSCYVIFYNTGSNTNSGNIRKYNLSTAWSIATAGSVQSDSLDVSSQDSYPLQFKFNADGTKGFMLGTTTDKVYEYSFTTAFDLDSGSYTGFNYDPDLANPSGLFFKSDGTKMFVVGRDSDKIYQYTFGGDYAGTAKVNIS